MEAQFGNEVWIRGLHDSVILCHPLRPRRDGRSGLLPRRGWGAGITSRAAAPSASPGLWHRWRGVHAVGLPLHPETDHRPQGEVPVLAYRMSSGTPPDMINMSV